MLNLFRGRSPQHLRTRAERHERHTTGTTGTTGVLPETSLHEDALPSGIPPEGRVVITISSQFGSGGSEIGRLVANEQGLLYLDHEIIGEVARRLGINAEQAERRDEQTVGMVRHVLDALQTNSPFSLNLSALMNPTQPPEHSQELVHWHLTRRVILEMATEGNAVIIGRGSQFLLHGSPRTLHIYIFAPLSNRIDNIMKRFHASHAEASEMVERRDYEHEAYLRRHYGSHQDRPELYHLLINTGLLPFDLAANLIQQALPLAASFHGSPS